jgi:protein-S-isoprenylcysteine O-methyltransferase Ste14
MYVAVTLILVSWAVAFSSTTLWIYAAVFAVASHIRVILAEEPFLRRMHNRQWLAYKSAVRRWF